MLEKVADWLQICKVHWKEIFAISFIMHFVFVWHEPFRDAGPIGRYNFGQGIYSRKQHPPS